MKILEVEFLEPVRSPSKGAGRSDMQNKWTTGVPEGPLHCRAMPGYIVMERDGYPAATLIPWANVKFAVVEFEETDAKAKK